MAWVTVSTEQARTDLEDLAAALKQSGAESSIPRLSVSSVTLW
jgi:hypothetical protein